MLLQRQQLATLTDRRLYLRIGPAQVPQLLEAEQVGAPAVDTPETLA